MRSVYYDSDIFLDVHLRWMAYTWYNSNTIFHRLSSGQLFSRVWKVMHEICGSLDHLIARKDFFHWRFEIIFAPLSLLFQVRITSAPKSVSNIHRKSTVFLSWFRWFLVNHWLVILQTLINLLAENLAKVYSSEMTSGQKSELFWDMLLTHFFLGNVLLLEDLL